MTGAAAAPGGGQAGGLGDNLRTTVQNTFIEVVGGSRQQDALRRARSAPAAVAGLALEAEQAAGQDRAGHGAAALTTVVLRNLPEDYSRELLLDILNVHDFGGVYDFVYMPIDFSSGLTFGFAFINLTAPDHAARFWAVFEGFESWQLDCPHAATVSWSASQGREALVDLHRNSPVMHESVPDECRPLVFSGGLRVPFPPPTRKILPLKRQRRRRPNVRSDAAESGSATSTAASGLAAAEPSLLLGALVPASDPLCKARLRHKLLLGGLSPLDPPACPTAPSWADMSESLDEDEYLSSVLLPGLRSWLATGAPPRKGPEVQDRGGAQDNFFSECSTDAGSSQRLPSDVGVQPQAGRPPCGRALAARAGAGAGAHRGRRAGRKSTNSASSTAPWTAGSFLVPGLVAGGPLCAGTPVRPEVVECEAP